MGPNQTYKLLYSKETTNKMIFANDATDKA